MAYREKRWVSLVFDRLRLLHRFGKSEDQKKIARHENAIHTGMLWGLRQMGLRRFLELCNEETEAHHAVRRMLDRSRFFPDRPERLEADLEETLTRVGAATEESGQALRGVQGELHEMTLMLRVQRKTA